MASRHEELGGAEENGTPQSRRYSSSPGLSSPPHSSPDQHNERKNGGLVLVGSSTAAAKGTAAAASASEMPSAASAGPPVKERKKPGRKPKINFNPDGSIMEPKRRVRKPRDPNAAPTSRKRKGTTSDAASAPEGRVVSGKQLKHDPENHITPKPDLDAEASKLGNNEGIPMVSFFTAPPPLPRPAASQTQPLPQQAPARTSGQNYDPIRSNYDPVRETVITHNSYNTLQGSPHVPSYTSNRASESPSIASLMDPPNQAMTSPSVATQSFFNQQQQARLQADGRTSIPASPTTNRIAPSPKILVESHNHYNKAPAAPAPLVAIASAPTPPAAKKDDQAITIQASSTTNKKSTTSSTAPSPKPVKAKEKEKERYPTPPPLPGSGLMQLGGTDGTEFRAPTICFEVKIFPGEGNKYVNFTRMAEDRYGWQALHPRLAAQKERLARVAAAGAALEKSGAKESGDEASDGTDSENDVEMGGMSDSRVGTDTGEKRVVKKRMMKEDFYDKDDGFVDDTELQWEEQAAAANDGFFVYSGPLVPETAKPEAENAPKRGRGRGRGGAARGGPGSRGGRVSGAAAAAAAAAATAATAVATSATNGIPIGPSGRPIAGPGSRGGSVTRKPRITKADRARMEQEKLEREKMGSLASMPNGYNGTALPSNLGTTPMVFN